MNLWTTLARVVTVTALALAITGIAHAARLLRAPPCRVRVAAGFLRGCGSLAPMHYKAASKTSDHGGSICQP